MAIGRTLYVLTKQGLEERDFHSGELLYEMQRPFRGLVVLDPLSDLSCKKYKAYDQVLDPGFKALEVVDDNLIATSFLPAWIFDAEALVSHGKVVLKKRAVSLGNLGLVNRGKMFVGMDRIFACLVTKNEEGVFTPTVTAISKFSSFH